MYKLRVVRERNKIYGDIVYVVEQLLYCFKEPQWVPMKRFNWGFAAFAYKDQLDEPTRSQTKGEAVPTENA